MARSMDAVHVAAYQIPVPVWTGTHRSSVPTQMCCFDANPGTAGLTIMPRPVATASDTHAKLLRSSRSCCGALILAPSLVSFVKASEALPYAHSPHRVCKAQHQRTTESCSIPSRGWPAGTPWAFSTAVEWSNHVVATSGAGPLGLGHQTAQWDRRLTAPVQSATDHDSCC
eukprot:364750-Chlamydomonas_euryale.AAC.12